MTATTTNQTLTQFVGAVSRQQHAMAGAVIAASAAQATALGLACMRISREALAPDDESIAEKIKRLASIKEELLDWCDRDATAIAEFVALREAGETLRGQQLLCNAPATIGHLAIEATGILQDFRPHVAQRVRDDLELSISLLAGVAQAAFLLLDSNLRIWPEPALLAEFGAVLETLEAGIGRLRPVKRIPR